MSKNPGDYQGIVDPVNAYVCSCIRRIRIDQGLTVSQMAARSGIPLGSYSCLETARYRLNLSNLFRFLLVLGVPIEEVWPQPAATLEPVQQVDQDCIQAMVEEAKRRLPRQIGLQDVIEAVCEEYGVTSKELSSPSRARHLAEARTVATVLVREQRHLTQIALSHRLKRDVSSLSHCLRRLKQREEYDRWIGGRVGRIRRKLLEGRKPSR